MTKEEAQVIKTPANDPMLGKPKRKVISISGLKQAGKDTTCSILINLLMRYNINTNRFAFADRLKLEVCEAYNISKVELEANKKFWRPVLQFWGTEFRRIYQKQDNYWINYLRQDIECFFLHYPNIDNTIAIITDCRYQNELEFLKSEYNTTFLWISRNIVVNRDTHASENSITQKDCQYIINNNTSISDLENEIYVNLRAAKIL